MSLDKLKNFKKALKDEEMADWPIGNFKVKGIYHIPEGEYDSKQHELEDIVHVDAHDYDSDTGFPNDEFDRIIQEKCAENLPHNHFDLTILETEQID